MSTYLSVFSGALSYEFLMQIRRRAVWITFLLLGILLIAIYSRSGPIIDDALSHPLTYALATWSRAIEMFLPLGFGCLLADRLVRDRRTKIEELFTTTQGGLSARLLGKYTGSTLATVVPFFLFYLIGVIFIVYRTHNLLAIPLSLEVFATVVLPGLLFVSAFSLACPLLMWVPLYQFGFIGYWFWGNALSPHTGIPTLSETLLTPNGKFMARGFYNIDAPYATATPAQGVASLLLLVGIAALVLGILYWILRWQQARQ